MPEPTIATTIHEGPSSRLARQPPWWLPPPRGGEEVRSKAYVNATTPIKLVKSGATTSTPRPESEDVLSPEIDLINLG
jgi:hypothetical protein